MQQCYIVKNELENFYCPGAKLNTTVNNHSFTLYIMGHSFGYSFMYVLCYFPYSTIPNLFMLHTFAILSVSLFLSSSACNKKVTQTNASLTGMWKLTEEINDPGDGSGTWKPTKNTSGFIRFKKDSTIETNVSFIEGLSSYTVDMDKITFSAPNKASYTYRYLLDNKLLEIYPNCFEKCGLRFRKQE